jgi:hypothetical protein
MFEACVAAFQRSSVRDEVGKERDLVMAPAGLIASDCRETDH